MSLEVFAPTPLTVTLNDGREVAILPLKLGQLPAFTKAAKAPAPYLFAADYLTILEAHPADAIEMIRIAAPLSAEAVEGLWQDEVVRLLSAIYEVNQGFFIQRLRPEMTQALTTAKARIATLAALAGVPSSPGSGSTGSALPTAST